MWIMGVFLKGAGTLAFVLDYVLRGAPASFLVFAVSDGLLAALTLWALTVEDLPRRTTLEVMWARATTPACRTVSGGG